MAAHIVEQANTFTQIRGPPFLVLDDKKIVMENNSNRLLTFGRRPDFHSAGQAKKCFDPFCLKITTTKSTQTNEDYIKKTKTPAAI